MAVIGSSGSHGHRAKGIKVSRMRDRKLAVGSLGSSGHLDSVGHAADNTLAFLMKHLREAVKGGVGADDLIQVTAGINNSRSSVDNKKLWHPQTLTTRYLHIQRALRFVTVVLCSQV